MSAALVLSVSASAAYLAMRRIADEIVIQDLNENMAQSHAMDLSQAAFLDSPAKIRFGGWPEAEHADVVVIAAGLPALQATHDSCKDILAMRPLIRSIAAGVKQYCPEAVVLSMTNPLDAFNYMLCMKLVARQFHRHVCRTACGSDGHWRSILAFRLTGWMPLLSESIIIEDPVVQYRNRGWKACRFFRGRAAGDSAGRRPLVEEIPGCQRCTHRCMDDRQQLRPDCCASGRSADRANLLFLYCRGRPVHRMAGLSGSNRRDRPAELT